MSKNNNYQYKSAFKFLSNFIKPHKKLYVAAIILSILLIFANIFQTYATSLLINNSVQGNAEKIVLSILFFILIISLNIVLTYKNGLFCAKLSSFCCRDMKRFIFNKLLNSRYSEIQKIKSGDMVNTINSDITNVCSFISSDLTDLFSQFAMAFAGFILLMFINPALCIVTFIYTPFGMMINLKLNKKMADLYHKSADYRGEALSVVEQALSCIPVIKSFTMEKQVVKRIKAKYDNVYDSEMNMSVYNALMQPACYSTSFVPKVIYMLFGGYLVINSKLSIGMFAAVFSMLDFIISPTVYFPFMLNNLNRAVASMNRIKRLENLPQEDMDSSIIRDLSDDSGPSLKINSLLFGYSNDKNIIENLNFQYSGPGMVVLRGSSGCGKTTLLDLICGLYEPLNGSIEIQGSIGVVPQESYIFPGSIMENIRCSKADASDKDVINAAEKAGADGFIKALPDGYDTVLESGNNLSGGQKQRIALARVVLRNAHIWILDEPTSALDKQTEKFVLDTIRAASEYKLIIAAAHRNSFIDCADAVLDLQGVVCNENA